MFGNIFNLQPATLLSWNQEVMVATSLLQ